jgi:ribosomal protein S18 acetylase RimI-like enzyme
MNVSLKDITIRTTLQPGDIGYLTYMHGSLYGKEYNFEVQFEVYVAEGLCEFYHNYDPQKDGVWIAEHNNRIIGFVLLMHRDCAAQLRYFIIDPAYRGIGLGKKLMDLYMKFLLQHGYKYSYLWTTNEQSVALVLYKRMGFTLTEEKTSVAFGKPVVEQRFELRV